MWKWLPSRMWFSNILDSLTINCESIWPGLSWKSCLTLVLFLVNFCKIMLTQLSVNVSVVEYTGQSMLELWPTKILPWVLIFALTKDKDQSSGYNYCSTTPLLLSLPAFVFRNKTKSLISFSSKPFLSEKFLFSKNDMHLRVFAVPQRMLINSYSLCLFHACIK